MWGMQLPASLRIFCPALPLGFRLNHTHACEMSNHRVSGLSVVEQSPVGLVPDVFSRTACIFFAPITERFSTIHVLLYLATHIYRHSSVSRTGQSSSCMTSVLSRRRRLHTNINTAGNMYAIAHHVATARYVIIMPIHTTSINRRQSDRLCTLPIPRCCA